MLQKKKYALMSDKELIDGLTAVPPNNRLHEYFFKEKCKHFLTYISNTLYNEDNYNILVGELYEYLSNDNWKILKMWEGKNGCSLHPIDDYDSYIRGIRTPRILFTQKYFSFSPACAIMDRNGK